MNVTRPLRIGFVCAAVFTAAPVTAQSTAHTTKPAAPAEAMNITAEMTAAGAGPGAAGSFTLTLSLADGWSAAEAGIPNAILQIDLPNGIELEGDIITEHRALARNEFLHAPFERMLEPGETTITFNASRNPSEVSGSIALNVVAYLRRGEATQAHFVRKRLTLPIKPGAQSRAADPGDTAWGDDRSGMQIGDKAQLFELPRADGSTVKLADHIGKHNVIVTTYRAFW